MWLCAVFTAVMWSTGFIVDRFIVGGADPNLFLVARFAGTAVLCLAVCDLWRIPVPGGHKALPHLPVGAIMLGLYLGLSYRAVPQGLPPAVMALIGASSRPSPCRWRLSFCAPGPAGALPLALPWPWPG